MPKEKTCRVCATPTKLMCPCATVRYCGKLCQRVDWKERGHREVCSHKKIRVAREAEAKGEAAKEEERLVFYGPAPRSRADEARARIRAEHEAARARREANPEPRPLSARYGNRCPVCLEDWDVNDKPVMKSCCCRTICKSCDDKIGGIFAPCPLCLEAPPKTCKEDLARLRRHADNDVPEAISLLGKCYLLGNYGLVKSDKKAARLFERAVELGDVDAMVRLGVLYEEGGTGVKMNKKKANKLFGIAADRGDAWALSFFSDSLLLNEKPDKAVSYLKAAVNQGYTDAEWKLGLLYETGGGVPQDFDEAKRLFAHAAAKGNECAARALARLNEREARDAPANS